MPKSITSNLVTNKKLKTRIYATGSFHKINEEESSLQLRLESLFAQTRGPHYSSLQKVQTNQSPHKKVWWGQSEAHSLTHTHTWSHSHPTHPHTHNNTPTQHRQPPPFHQPDSVVAGIVKKKNMYRDVSSCNTYNYGDALYWDARYIQEGGSFDWYQRYSALRHFVRHYLPLSSRLLMVGCGNAGK